MALYQNKYRIESARLKEWNYSTPWWYYITINTKNHVQWFGKIKNSKMRLSELGEMVDKCWLGIPKHFPNVELDYYIIMPNHLHGIIIINPDETDKQKQLVETGYIPSLQQQKPKTISLSIIIGTFKAAVTRWCNQNVSSLFAWQERFYERIIRNEKELFQIRKYISENPLRWEIEKETPENLEL